MSNAFTTHWNFLRAGLLKHGQTGGILPSQGFLIDRMIAPIPESYGGQIIELGAGTGALTLRLAVRCPEARIMACEINPTLARDARSSLTMAGVNGRAEVVTDSAEHFLSELGQGGRVKSAFIVSGIPLGNLGGERADGLLRAIHQALGEGGMYIQFQHSLLDRKKIRARFARLRTVPVLLNLPPAVVYYAER